MTNVNSNVLLNAAICNGYHCQHNVDQINIWSFWYLILFSFPVGSFFQNQNTLNHNHRLSYLGKPLFASTSPSFRIKRSEIGISTLYLTTFLERNSHKSRHLSIQTPLGQNYSEHRENVYSRVFVMIYFVFFYSSIATAVPPPLFCSTWLTFLLNIFWAIHQELLCISMLKKLAKLQKKLWWGFFGKKLQYPNLLKWNSTISVILGITNIIFWGIFRNKYYMESLQITDKFCLSPLIIFLNMAYI